MRMLGSERNDLEAKSAEWATGRFDSVAQKWHHCRARQQPQIVNGVPRMKMPPAPRNTVPTARDRLFAWISRHKLASVVIAIVAFMTIVSSIEAAGGANQAAPSSPAAVSTASSSKPSESPQPTLHRVPSIANLSVGQARSRLQSAGFTVLLVAKYSQQAPGTLLNISAV